MSLVVTYHSKSCAVCRQPLECGGWWLLRGEPTHEPCGRWDELPFPYARQAEVMRRLARHAEPRHARDVLLAALAIERLAAGWPDRALARLQRARDLAAFVRARTTGAPDKLKSAL